MRRIILIVGIALGIAIMAVGISYAGDAAGVYQDAPCYIGGSSANQDNTCPHGYFASDTLYVETPSGTVIMTCLFDPIDIPSYCQVDELYMNKDFGCFISYSGKSVYTFDSQFVKTPGGQAMLKCKGNLP
jgi:hypothetical protein